MTSRRRGRRPGGEWSRPANVLSLDAAPRVALNAGTNVAFPVMIRLTFEHAMSATIISSGAYWAKVLRPAIRTQRIPKPNKKTARAQSCRAVAFSSGPMSNRKVSIAK